MSNFKDPEIIQLCLEKLSEIHGTSVQLLHSNSVGGGCINRAIRLGTSVGDFFLKWNSAGPADIFVREAEGLIEMHMDETSGLYIPKVIWSKSGDERPGLLLLEFLNSPKSDAGFDERLGRGIAQLHRKTADRFGFHHANYCGTTVQDNRWNNSWSDFYAHQRIWNLVLKISHSKGMSAEDQRVYEKLVDKIPELVSHTTIPSLIHGDLWSGNYMYTSRGPALIDPACCYADREMELGMMKLFGGFSPVVWAAYQEEFPLPNDWKQRIRLYQLYHILNHYYLFGGAYSRQALEIAKEYI